MTGIFSEILNMSLTGSVVIGLVLQERGYKVDRCCCVDMFPSTGNVETVAILSRVK